MSASPAPISLKAGAVTVVLVHGFTGSPAEMRLLAEAFHGAGYSVEAPLLIGHGSRIEDLLKVRPEQWLEQINALVSTLVAHGRQVVLAGPSLGSILALHTAMNRQEVKALLLYAPPIRSSDPRRFLAPVLMLMGSTIAKPSSNHDDPETEARLWSYSRYPVRCSARVLKLIGKVRKKLANVQQPVLAMASRRDNVVSARGMERLMRDLRCTDKQLHWLERSSHTITADSEWQSVRDQSLRFLQRVAPTQQHPATTEEDCD